MRRQETSGDMTAPAALECELGGPLKTYFDDLIAGPAPDRLVKLTEALELALEQGRLPCRAGRRS